MPRLSTMSIRFMALALVAAGGCGGNDKPDPLGPEDAILVVSGTPVSNLSGGEDSRRLYKIVVPAGQALLTVTTSGGTGDVDLYMRLGALPTLTDNDCFSIDVDNEELCEVPDPGAGDWYILLEGYERYDGVTLTATYSPPAP